MTHPSLNVRQRHRVNDTRRRLCAYGRRRRCRFLRRPQYLRSLPKHHVLSISTHLLSRNSADGAFDLLGETNSSGGIFDACTLSGKLYVAGLFSGVADVVLNSYDSARYFAFVILADQYVFVVTIFFSAVVFSAPIMRIRNLAPVSEEQCGEGRVDSLT